MIRRAIHIHVHVSVCERIFSFLQGKYLRVGLLAHMLSVLLTFNFERQTHRKLQKYTERFCVPITPGTPHPTLTADGIITIKTNHDQNQEMDICTIGLNCRPYSDFTSFCMCFFVYFWCVCIILCHFSTTSTAKIQSCSILTKGLAPSSPC